VISPVLADHGYGVGLLWYEILNVCVCVCWLRSGARTDL